MKLLIADDHSLFREGLSLLVTHLLPHCTIYQAENWEKVHEALAQYYFDVMLLDIFMPRQQTWEEELIKVIKKETQTIICVISASSEKELLQTLFRVGVKGYICKTASSAEIINALLQIIEGNRYFPAQLLQEETGENNSESIHLLTLRQKAILKLMIEGKSNKTIAEELHLTENTVKRHIYNICKILNVNSRVEAVSLILKKELLNYIAL
ncbi:response regulator transcription factor [Thioflexithrix psekupsensis]|uniref:DNA-binding response regulator n=1 Tax=Thioflexithrix psekupsensis TaxID=1570016 RepID=A0A251X519_9GAMM|nr:response regulator transcription factor [Thioflexithrix psekupsensis]OUD12299.1 hypothetical protein TPSD3_14370 [Thioflexithrix psekupsensis]